MHNKKWYSIIYGDWNTGGGTGGCLMETSESVPETHGGLEAGTDINGLPPCDVLKMILYPYQYPQFTSFYIQNQPTTLEIGDSVTGGIRTFIWDTNHDENIQDNSIKIEDVTANVVLANALANDGTEALDIGDDKVSNQPNSTYTWRISGVNTKGDTFSRNFNVVWRARVYWGNSENDTLTGDEVKNLNNSALKANALGNYSFSYDGTEKYYYWVFPEDWTFSGIKDIDTGFEVDWTEAGSVDVTNDFNVTLTYKLYRTTYKQASDLNSQVY